MRFAAKTVSPDWPDGVDDSTCLEAICAGYSSLASRALTNPAAFFEKLWPSGVVYSPVYASTSKKRHICGIHNRINIEIGYVSTDSMYSSNHLSCASVYAER